MFVCESAVEACASPCKAGSLHLHLNKTQIFKATKPIAAAATFVGTKPTFCFKTKSLLRLLIPRKSCLLLVKLLGVFDLLRREGGSQRKCENWKR